MNEPRRLMDGTDDFELALLRAGRDDRPDPAARGRLLASMGIAAGIAGASVTAATASAAVGAAGAPAAPAATSWGSAAVIKWIAVSVLGGGLAVGSAAMVTASAPPPELAAHGYKAEVVKTSAGVRAVVVAAREAETAAREPELAAEAAPEAPAPEVRPVARAARAGSPRSEAAPDASALAGEIAVLDRARAALATNDPAAAIAALGDHDQQYGSGVLSPEAVVLRIEALSAQGRDADARRLGEQFLAQHPQSPLARRVRSVLARGASDGSGASGAAARGADR